MLELPKIRLFTINFVQNDVTNIFNVLENSVSFNEVSGAVDETKACTSRP